METAITNFFTAIWSNIEGFMGSYFYPPLAMFFIPVEHGLEKLPNQLASICGIGLFLGAMAWVCLLLNRDYVNRGRPYKSMLTDLRLWTVISMTPHVLVYFYFR